MKKLNLINIFLVLVLFIFYIYQDYKKEKNLDKIEERLITNYNNLNYQNLIEENKALNNMLNLKNSNLNTIVVKGIFISPYEEFIINKGKTKNVNNGMAVINEKGLVGFVRNAKENYANIELLENLSQKISIKVNEKYGFLEAKNNKLIITGIKEENMKVNDLVYTSGLTEIPGNIYIGKIKEISGKDETFETKAYIEIEGNYQDYKYLLVVPQWF